MEPREVHVIDKKYPLPVIKIDYKKEVRCPNPNFRGTGYPCKRRMFFGEVKKGSAIEYKCPKCGEIYKLEFM